MLARRLKEPQPLVPFHLEGRDPTYLLAGGLLFEALSGARMLPSSHLPSGLAKQCAPGQPCAALGPPRAGTCCPSVLAHLPCALPARVPPAVPYLFSEFGPDFPSKAPVTLIEKLLFGWKNSSDEEVGGMRGHGWRRSD